MADNNETTTTAGPFEQVAGVESAETSPEGLGEGGIKALQAEREARRQAEKTAKDLEAQLNEASAKVQQFEDANKSDLEKAHADIARAQEAVTAAEERARVAETALLRFEVAAEKGLTGEALNLLDGDSREDIEAKADAILKLIDTSTPAGPVVRSEGHSPTSVMSDAEVQARQILLG